MDQSLSGGFLPPMRVFICLFSIPESYLVDPASNHTLVSEINPGMSKFTLFHCETANGSLNRSRFLTCHDPYPNLNPNPNPIPNPNNKLQIPQKERK